MNLPTNLSCSPASSSERSGHWNPMIDRFFNLHFLDLKFDRSLKKHNNRNEYQQIYSLRWMTLGFDLRHFEIFWKSILLQYFCKTLRFQYNKLKLNSYGGWQAIDYSQHFLPFNWIHLRAGESKEKIKSNSLIPYQRRQHVSLYLDNSFCSEICSSVRWKLHQFKRVAI